MSTPIAFGSAERPDGRLLRFSLEREWSCPIHDDEPDRWDDDGDYIGDDEFSCNGCRAAGWKVAYDADGWATITVHEVGPWEKMLRQMRHTVVESLSTPHHLLLEMLDNERVEFGGTKLLTPIMPASKSTTLPTD